MKHEIPNEKKQIEQYYSNAVILLDAARRQQKQRTNAQSAGMMRKRKDYTGEALAKKRISGTSPSSTVSIVRVSASRSVVRDVMMDGLIASHPSPVVVAETGYFHQTVSLS